MSQGEQVRLALLIAGQYKTGSHQKRHRVIGEGAELVKSIFEVFREAWVNAEACQDKGPDPLSPFN